MDQSDFEANTCNQHQASVKRGKTRACKARLVLVWFPIGCEDGANIANQSQSAVKQTKANANYFQLSIENSIATNFEI